MYMCVCVYIYIYAWLVWFSGLSTILRISVTDSIPSQGTCLGAGLVPIRGYLRGNHTSVFLSLSFCLPPPLSKNKISFLKKNIVLTHNLRFYLFGQFYHSQNLQCHSVTLFYICKRKKKICRCLLQTRYTVLGNIIRKLRDGISDDLFHFCNILIGDSIIIQDWFVLYCFSPFSFFFSIAGNSIMINSYNDEIANYLK